MQLKRLKKQSHKKKNKAGGGGFQSLGLIPMVYRGVMKKGYLHPTSIQRKTMPLILAGADVVAMARTGSGKTAAFLVPMLQKPQQHIPGNGVRALILSPTRDLAIQTLKFTKELGKFTGSSEIVWLRCSSLSKRLEICGLKRKAKTFKDDEYYISSVPTNQHHEAGLSVKNNEGFASSRLDAAVLDLVADDGAGLQKQKSVYHWDKKSKKYIKLNNGERVTASGKIKTESGAKVKASKTGIYKKWKERSHKQISLDGSKDTKEDGTAHGGGRQIRGGNKWQLKGGRNRRSIPNANVPSELRDPEQVRKDRQQKATKIAQFKNKLSSKKGNNKFGKDKGNSKFGKDKGNNKFGKNKGQKKSKGRF